MSKYGRADGQGQPKGFGLCPSVIRTQMQSCLSADKTDSPTSYSRAIARGTLAAAVPPQVDRRAGLVIILKPRCMQDIGARYPAWLEKHAASLSQEDLARYTAQHQHIIDICKLYESHPEDFGAIYDKLQQVNNIVSCSEMIQRLMSGCPAGDEATFWPPVCAHQEGTKPMPAGEKLTKAFRVACRCSRAAPRRRRL